MVSARESAAGLWLCIDKTNGGRRSTWSTPSLFRARTMSGPRHIIFVAEERIELRTLLALACEREGFDVVEATSGRELVELMRLYRDSGWLADVVLIVSDVTLPELDGFGAYEALAGEGFETPFVFVSASDDPAAQARALPLRSLGFLTQPFDPEALRRLLRAYFRQPPD
ncbi:MAG TPA: response regulator [Polyangiaceae bacterium]|nr:response regulator [Polyangiaceae bacterium]